MEEVGINIKDMLPGLFGRKKKQQVKVSEAREILVQQEAEKLIDRAQVAREARYRVEQGGMIFLDEIDKIAGREGSRGPDVSREGVQRDLLPIVEGTNVSTKYGMVKTDHILFIAAGAFHVSKPSDLIPEMQGRFPIRVELDALSEQDFVRILTEPETALTKQYSALLSTESVTLEFTADSVDELARLAVEVNSTTENIGARRLSTLMERLLDEVSFDAPEMAGAAVKVDGEYVRESARRDRAGPGPLALCALRCSGRSGSPSSVCCSWLPPPDAARRGHRCRRSVSCRRRPRSSSSPSRGTDSSSPSPTPSSPPPARPWAR